MLEQTELTSTGVFLFEDQNLVRQALRRLLEQAGIQVIGEAVSAADAIVEVKRLKPQVAIVDFPAPGRDGIDVIREIVGTGPTRVLVLSMYADSESVSRALEAGATGYLLKDSSLSELVRAVRCIAAGEAFFSPAVATFIADHYQEACSSGAPTLSRRETDVLRLIALGNSGKEIACALAIAPGTVETHRRRLMLKLGCTKLAQLTLYAVQKGVVSSQDPLKGRAEFPARP